MKYIIIYQTREDQIDGFGNPKGQYNWCVAEDSDGYTLYFDDYDHAEQFKRNMGWYGQVIAI